MLDSLCSVVILTIHFFTRGANLVTIFSYEGNITSLNCGTSSLDYPGWTGPPDGMTYSYTGNPQFNNKTLQGKFHRLQWHTNKRDLIIKNVSRTDGGTYQCSLTDVIFSVKLVVLVCPSPPEIERVQEVNNRAVVPGTENKNIKLTCTSRGGYPESDLVWYNENNSFISSKNKTSEPGNTVTVTITTDVLARRDFDLKRFTCQSSFNTHCLQSTSVILYLSLNPSKPMIKGILTAEEGTSTHLQCTSMNCRPQGNISWIFDGHVIVKGVQSVKIPSSETYKMTSNYTTRMLLKTDNGKNITCRVEHESIDSFLTTSSRLDVQFAPLTVNLTGNTMVTVNGNKPLKLTCIVSSANPVSNITWTHNGTHITNITEDHISASDNNGEVRVQGITLTPTRTMDGDVITCEAKHFLLKHSDPISQQVSLDLRYEPITTITGSSKKTVTEGDSDVTFTCEAWSKPASSFIWYKNGFTSVTDVIKLKSCTANDNRCLYTIPTVYRNHTGNYSCTAENNVGASARSTANIELIVNYPPDITVTTANTTVNSTYHDIECVAKGVPSTYIFSAWTQCWPGSQMLIRNHLLSEDTNSSSRRTFRLNSPTYRDSGIYTCGVNNGVKNQISNGSVYLLVRSFPVVVYSSSKADKNVYKIPGTVDTEVSFSVTVYSNAGDILAKLYRLADNTRVDVKKASINVNITEIKLLVYGIEVNSDGYMVTVTHKVLSSEEFGNFSLDITNDIGTVSLSLNITAAGPPCTPTNVSVEAVGSGSITLSWIRCFHGGFAQTFVVQLRTSGSDWMNGSFVQGGLSQSDSRLTTTLVKLQPNTKYEVRLFSFNDGGNSGYTNIYGVMTEPVVDPSDSAQKIGTILGSAAGGVVGAVLVIFLVIFIIRRQTSFHGSQKSSILKEDNRNSGSGENKDSLEVNLNPMYESAGPPTSSSKSHETNSEVKTKKKTDLYADVKKTGSTETDLGKLKQKKKNAKPGKKTRMDKSKEGMIYENADTHHQGIGDADNVYENPSFNHADEKPVREKNKDGLIYVEVTLPRQDSNPDRKVIIHGLEDGTEYADILFGKVGEAAPESDEEDNKKKKKKLIYLSSIFT